MVSNTTKKKLLRVSELDEKSDTYTMSAYLVAQLGKNFSENGENEITGEELLKLAWDKIKEMQYLGGGMVSFFFVVLLTISPLTVKGFNARVKYPSLQER